MDRPATAKKFRTEFDGDEIDGKFYKLGQPVTGLDGATGAYLVRIGRLTEITDEAFEDLVEQWGDDGDDDQGDAETDEEREERERLEEAQRQHDERLEAAGKRFESGDIPTDLLKDGTTDLKTEAELRALAGDLPLRSSMTKAAIATAIMADRDRVAAEAEANA
jgi:hypothetical protein